MFIDFFVANGRNLVNEDHNVSFQNFSCISEVPDVTEAKDSHDFLTRNHSIDEIGIFKYFADDLSASLTKSNGKE